MTAVRLLDPTLSASGRTVPLAPRLLTLDGAVLGLVNNGKTHGREILERVAENLGRRYRLADVRLMTKAHPSAPPSEAEVSMMAEHAMAIVSAIGD